MLLSGSAQVFVIQTQEQSFKGIDQYNLRKSQTSFSNTKHLRNDLRNFLKRTHIPLNHLQECQSRREHFHSSLKDTKTFLSQMNFAKFMLERIRSLQRWIISEEIQYTQSTFPVFCLGENSILSCGYRKI